MPVVRYFLFAGGVLLALLFVLDSYLPKSTVVSAAGVNMTTPNVRIRSDQKLPERIVYDMSLPTIIPVQTAAVIPAQAPQAADVPAKTAALDSFAQLSSSDIKIAPKAPPKRKVAKRRVQPSPAPIIMAQQPRFGFFANNLW